MSANVLPIVALLGIVEVMRDMTGQTAESYDVAVVDGGEPRNAPAAAVHGFLTKDAGVVGTADAGVRVAVAINAGLIAEDTRHAVAAHRDRRLTSAAGGRS